jgi:hypothetical protein
MGVGPVARRRSMLLPAYPTIAHSRSLPGGQVGTGIPMDRKPGEGQSFSRKNHSQEISRAELLISIDATSERFLYRMSNTRHGVPNGPQC